MNRSLASVLLSVVTVASTACMVDAQGRGAEGTFSRSLTVSGPVQLDVETGSGDIEVRTAAAGVVRVEGRVQARWALWDEGDADDRVREVRESPPIEQSGNDIHIGRRRWNNVRISYVVTVPADTTVRVQTGSGDVIVGDVKGQVSARAGSGDVRIGRVGGDVRARTGSGDVELIEGAGNVTVSTGSGDVRAKVVGSGRADVSTGSGDVRVDGASGPLRVRTGSGRITVEGAPAANWDLGAGSGDISVETPPAAAFDVEARSASGDLDLRSVAATEKATRRSVRGTVRGGGPLVSMSTGSGEVRIR